MLVDRPERLAVVGLGYVGLSLAIALARKFGVTGFDIDTDRIEALNAGADSNGMFERNDLNQPSLHFVSQASALADADVVIVAVPTPVDAHDAPDLSALVGACEMVGSHLHRGSMVVFESTVYPGCTEEECIPVLERISGLVAHQDFGVGYSPERIDPGDSSRGLESIIKVVSAGDAATLETIANMYAEVVPAGIHRAPSIRVAEAAKVIENIQRDLNIALMNELSVLFHAMDVDTTEVLEAAGTKWNFGHYYPGLVGGHCIPVDPFYLVHKAQQLGHEPKMVLAGRKVNESMPEFVAGELARLINGLGGTPHSTRALVLGLTFKEDVRDTRNAQSSVLVDQLERRGVEVWVTDPWVAPTNNTAHYIKDPFATDATFDIVILAIPHKEYRTAEASRFLRLLRDPKAQAVFMDLRSVFDRTVFTDAGVTYWAL